ncbi:39S ribosomal protein L47, mitochondrial, partial [Linum grandiflorum]
RSICSEELTTEQKPYGKSFTSPSPPPTKIDSQRFPRRSERCRFHISQLPGKGEQRDSRVLLVENIQETEYIMFMMRFFGRSLLASARSESSTATAATTARLGHNPLEEFFEIHRNPDEDKPVVYGRSWKASELRLKSWDDLQKLWYVLLKEKNMLMTQRQMVHSQNLRFPNPERLPKVRKSMCRIKQVLTERAIEDPDPRRSAEMKRMINSL